MNLLPRLCCRSEGFCTRNDKKITWTFLVLKAWCDTKQENCNEPSPSLVWSIWRIYTRNDKKITRTFLALKASRFDHFSCPPCSLSCVSQIDYPVSRADYTTDDSSRIDSNRVDSTTFSTLPVCLLVWFSLSVSQVDYPVSRIDYTTHDSSRIDSNRVDFTTFPTLLVRLFLWFFLSVSQIDFPVSRIDYTTDDLSRIDSNRVDSTTFPTLPALTKILIRAIYGAKLEIIRQKIWN